MLPLHLAPDMQTGVSSTSGPVPEGPVASWSWPLSSPSETAWAWGGLPTGQPDEPPSAIATFPPLIWGGFGGSVLYISARASLLRPPRFLSTRADLSTLTRDPLFLLASPVGSCFFPVSSLFGIYFLSFFYSNSVSTEPPPLTIFPSLLLDFHAAIAKSPTTDRKWEFHCVRIGETRHSDESMYTNPRAL